ncbi:MAG: T9SS type A sorting domain-containing protein [Bacteroidales bacterium]|nr:T9SS type A sorting domain-containing protein [Bacteroidales bacterium]
MKKIVILIVLITAFISSKAQAVLPYQVEPDSSTYDTLVVFNPFAQYPCWQDSVVFSWINTVHIDYHWVDIYAYDDDGNIELEENGDTTILYTVQDYSYGEDIGVWHDINYTLAYQTLKYKYLGDGNYDTLTAFNYDWFPSYTSPVMNPSLFGISELAQPWHLDSSAIICGVYADLIIKGGRPAGPKIYLRDTNFNILAETMQVCGKWGYEQKVFHHFYFYKEIPYDYGHYVKHTDVTAKDFYITAEAGESLFKGHTCSIYEPDPERLANIKKAGYPYDTIFIGKLPNPIDKDALEQPYTNLTWAQEDILIRDSIAIISNPNHHEFAAWSYHPKDSIDLLDHPFTDTIPLYKATESPLFYRDGQWTKFADDTIYYLFQTMGLKFLPIILVPKSESSLNQPDSLLESNVWVFPNPASDFIKVTSGFFLNKIEIYNTAGVKVFEDNTRSNQQQINISSFDKGAYIVKLYTPRGIVSRKIIKQ